MEKKIIYLIDPPHGYLYGFPKEFPIEVDNVYEWLVENGYPQHIINNLGDSFVYRIIEREKEE